MLNLNDKYPFSLNNIGRMAQDIIALGKNCHLFMIEGEMGSGKTTLIKELSKTLGSIDNLSSPTFSIVNEYNSPKGKIYHFDLYRLKNTEELLDIGFEDYIHSGNYCFIEWPQLAEQFLKTGFIKINLYVSENIHYLCASKF